MYHLQVLPKIPVVRPKVKRLFFFNITILWLFFVCIVWLECLTLSAKNDAFAGCRQKISVTTSSTSSIGGSYLVLRHTSGFSSRAFHLGSRSTRSCWGLMHWASIRLSSIHFGGSVVVYGKGRNPLALPSCQIYEQFV